MPPTPASSPPSPPLQSGPPPAPPSRYDAGGGVMVTTSHGAGSSQPPQPPSQVLQYAPAGNHGSSSSNSGAMGMPIPPVYPQRPEGNISKQVGHVCMTYSNINHEIPHSEWAIMDEGQRHTFHNYSAPLPWHQGQSKGQGRIEAAPASKHHESIGGKQCALCDKGGDVRMFEHSGREWKVCVECASTAFGAEGVKLWRNGRVV